MLSEILQDQQPHPVDSEANRIIETRLINLVRSMGFNEEIQDTPICEDWKHGVVRCTRVRNIIVEVKGSQAEEAILLSAHYDSVPAGPGASDAGAAVATLLESMRLLSLEPQPRNDIIFLFNEGEEFGLFGAKAFIQQHPLAEKVRVALNIEARGSAGKSVMFETGENSGWLVKHYANVSTAPVSSSLFYEVYKYLPNDTDLTVYKEAGLQGLNFAHAEKEPHYHTPLDNLSNLSAGTIQLHGDNVWGVLQGIKDMDLTQTERGNVIFADIAGLFVVYWQENLSIVASLFILAILALLHWHFFARDWQSHRAVLAVIAWLFISVIVFGLTAWGIQWLVQHLAATPTPWRANQIPMRITVWLGTSCFGLLLTDYLVRKSLEKINTNATDSTSRSDLIIRLMALIWFWALLGLITSIASPGISFLFILPGLAGALVAIYVYFRIKTHKELYSPSTTVSLITMVAVSSAVFLPIAYVFEVLVGYNIALAIGIILGFSTTALLPMLSLQTTAIRPYRRISSCTLVIAALALVWTTRYPAYSVAMPQALNIFYVQNNTNSARVLAGFQQSRLPHSLSSELEKFSGALSHTGELFWETQKYHQVTVPSAGLEPSLLAIVDIQHSEPKRSVTVQLTTDPGDLSDLRIFIKEDAGLESIAYLNQTFHYTDEESGRNGYYEYHCRGTSCADLRLTFNFSHREKVHLRVVKAIQGLPTELKHLASARGADATQRQQGDQTYIYADYDI